MRVKVIMPFKDKYKKVVYQKGQEIEVTNERFEELTSAAPFVEAISESAPKKPAPKKPTPKKSTKKKTAKK